MTKQNLSEQLFKPKFNYPETSSLIQRINSGNKTMNSLLDGEGRSNWYRVINRLAWHLRGLPLAEIEDVLARIAVSNKNKTNPEWLDTVIGYQSGNWIYEFLTQSTKWRQKAELASQSVDTELTDEQNATNHHSWLTASLFAGLAAYPYYRNDELANQALTLANRYYHHAMNYSPYQIKELEFTVDNKSIRAILHTPLTHNDEVRSFPVVLLCAGLNNLQLDFYYYFTYYLAPQGIGLLTVDTPSINNSKQINLTQNTSIIHQAILEQIQRVPLIDYSNIILLGYRFGGNIALRLAYLMPHKIKGIINIGPIIHQLFTNESLQAELPTIYRDVIASRLGLTVISDQQLQAELKFFSLKEQGLLSRPCSVPILNIYYDSDRISSLDEMKLITSTKKVSLIQIKALTLKESFQQSSQQIANWIKTIIK